MARNTVCDWHRKHAGDLRRVQGHLLADGSEGEALCETFPSLAPNAEAIVSKRSEQQALLRQLKGLTRLQRKVLWLRLVRGLSYPEIAKKMGLSISAAKCAFYRAKLALRETLEPAYAY